MEKYEWTPSGKYLLDIIKDYIRSNGGRASLAKQIIDEDRRAREAVWRSSYNKVNGIKARRKVLGTYNGAQVLFNSPSDVSVNINSTGDNIRSAIRQGCNHKDWKFIYV